MNVTSRDYQLVAEQNQDGQVIGWRLQCQLDGTASQPFATRQDAIDAWINKDIKAEKDAHPNLSHLNELSSIIDRLRFTYINSLICDANASDLERLVTLAKLQQRVEITLLDLERLIDRIVSDASKEACVS